MTSSRRSSSSPNSRRRTRRRRPWWASLSDQELLDVRLCDLELKIEHSELQARVDQLHDELNDRGLRPLPHVWLSNEWFSPDGVPGIAIPFFLAHERLRRLENRHMLEVEGGGERHCMRLLRHEAGHALCTAHRLHYRRRWREVFGPMSQPYPDSYLPRAQSKHYVLHLDWWYAQAHPAEDFAETFAVWLAPNSRWRRQYRGWPAMKKLRYVDELMGDVEGKTPKLRSRRFVDPLSTQTTTLREYYTEKQSRYGQDGPEIYDRDLRRLFSDEARYADRPSAAAFLRSSRPRIRVAVSRWTGEYQYAIDLVLRSMIKRCRELRLRVPRDEEETVYDATVLVAVQTTKFLHRVPQRILL